MTRLSVFVVRYRTANWPDAWRDDWDERAAILEFDAGLSRDEAEIAAYEMVLAQRIKPRKEAAS